MANDDEAIGLNRDRAGDVEVSVYKFMMYIDHFAKEYYAFETMTGGIYCGADFWRLLLSIWEQCSSLSELESVLSLDEAILSRIR